MLILVDSSAWVDFFLDQAHDADHPLLRLGEEKRIATNWIIRTEVLSGASSEPDYTSLDERFRALHQLALTEEVWTKTARLRWELRRYGLTLPTTDVAIASCAMVYGCELFQVDRHFELIAKHAPLKVYKSTRSTTA